MPSIFSHAFLAAALGDCYHWESKPLRFWLLSVGCSILPDADVLSFFLGIPYSHVLGHRGISHSLAFAMMLALAVTTSLAFAKEKWFSKAWCGLVAYFFIVTASHGFLDALTNGGLGVAFLAPFDNTRYFLPWRPIEVSPIGLDFFGPEGVIVLLSELKWIWLPAGLLVAMHRTYRRLASREI